MYKKNSREDMIARSAALLSDEKSFYLAAIHMTAAWTISTELYLSYPQSNRRAWLGQASCCYAHGAVEDETKAGWWRMTEAARTAANAVATRVITNWERLYYYEETLFDEP